MSKARTEAISLKAAEAPPSDAVGDAFTEGRALGRSDARRESQEFFAKLVDEIRAPHTGDQHRATINDLLRRAESAGLYSPPKES